MRCLFHTFALLCGLLLFATVNVQARMTSADIPHFQVRARVITTAGEAPLSAKAFSITLFGTQSPLQGDTWGDWITIDKPLIEAGLIQYPNILIPDYPFVAQFTFYGLTYPANIQMEARFQDANEQPQQTVSQMSGELLGPVFGLLVWRETDTDRTPQIANVAQYNERYWAKLAGINLPEAQRPKIFPIGDSFSPGDNDRKTIEDGYAHLTRFGFNLLQDADTKIMKQYNLHYAAGGVYGPPNYYFDPEYDAGNRDSVIMDVDVWAREQAKMYADQGIALKDVVLFMLADEPNWSYLGGMSYETLPPRALVRFHALLKAQGLTPADLGAKSWDDVKANLRRTEAIDTPSRRLFYWSARFFSLDSTHYYARCTRALEKAFYTGLPVAVNFNFGNGRMYVPGDTFNNTLTVKGDAGTGGFDWLEFGRLRGGTMLWAEDWFSDEMAPTWSFLSAKLRSAAELGGLEFGGYIIPRTSGSRTDGILQKILCLVGNGGKQVKYFQFGPEYTFPQNCYSELLIKNPTIMEKMAEAHGMIGKAEDLILPGKCPRSPVAILAPRSAEMWDNLKDPTQTVIADCGNLNPNVGTVDYMAEAFNIYVALQHANIPVTFVDEDNLTPQGLKPYRALYVTEPNIPVEGQKGLLEWVKKGGVLVTVSGAGTSDRYNDPCSVLSDALGIAELPRERLLVPDVDALPMVAKGRNALGDFTAYGARGVLRQVVKGTIEATFEDGSPAVIKRETGRGAVIHFAWLPGISYRNSKTGTQDLLPVGFSKAIRDMIVAPVKLAGVTPPVAVSQALVETPLLLSDKGGVVTLLNWTGKPIESLTMTVRVPFTVRSLESVKWGKRPFSIEKGLITCTLPLDAADMVMLRP